MISIQKTPASGGLQLQRTLSKAPQNSTLTSLQPFLQRGYRKQSFTQQRNSNTKGSLLLITMQLWWAPLSALPKLHSSNCLFQTSQATCWPLQLHLLFATITKAKFVFLPWGLLAVWKENLWTSSKTAASSDCPSPHTTTWALLKNHFSSQTPAGGCPGMGLPGDTLAAGLLGHPEASSEGCLPCPSHSLILALMDIKNRTEQKQGWEQNTCTTGLDGCSHSAVKCKNKKGHTSCIPQDASRFFNIVVPPRIPLRMLHYIYMSLKYLPFFWILLGALRARYKPSSCSCVPWLSSSCGWATSIC